MGFVTRNSGLLTNAELQRLGGRYTGTIAGVTAETLHNRWKARNEEQPVVEFSDGLRMVLNQSMLKALINIGGRETDDWVGLHVCVFLRDGRRGKERALMLAEAPAHDDDAEFPFGANIN